MSHELPHEIFMLFKEGLYTGRTADPFAAYEFWYDFVVEKKTTGEVGGYVEVMTDDRLEVILPTMLNIHRWKRYGFPRGH